MTPKRISSPASEAAEAKFPKTDLDRGKKKGKKGCCAQDPLFPSLFFLQVVNYDDEGSDLRYTHTAVYSLYYSSFFPNGDGGDREERKKKKWLQGRDFLSTKDVGDGRRKRRRRRRRRCRWILFFGCSAFGFFLLLLFLYMWGILAVPVRRKRREEREAFRMGEICIP